MPGQPDGVTNAGSGIINSRLLARRGTFHAVLGGKPMK